MRVIIFGSRSMENPKPIYQRLAALEPPRSAYVGATIQRLVPVRVEPITVVHGKALGADMIADVCAKLLDYEVDPHPAEWRPGGVFDRSAGHRRNAEMVKLGADLAIGYWDGKSPGTAGMIKLCDAAEFPLEVWTCEGDRFEGYRGRL